MKQYFFIIILNFSLFFACKEYNPEIKAIDKCKNLPCDFAPYLWKKRITDEAYTYSCIDLPIVYNNAGLVAMRRNDSTFFQMIESETGNIQWELFRKLRNGSAPLFEYDIWKGYQYDNFLIIPFWGIDGSGFEKINLETGECQELHNTQKIKTSYNVVVTGIDSLFFFNGCDDSKNYEFVEHTTVFYGNVETGVRKKLCDLPIENELDTLIVEVMIPSVINNQIHVLIGYTYKNKGYLSLFNKDTKSWIYTNIDFNVPWLSSRYFVSYPYFYISSGRDVNGIGESYLICGNITNGQFVWANNSYELYSQTIEINNKLLVQNIKSKTLASINKFNGEQIWITEKDPYRYLQELNGIIYFDSGYIYAFDAETGEWLWYLEPHDGTRFNECKVVPGKDGKKGHILASSDKHVYCFEAIK